MSLSRNPKLHAIAKQRCRELRKQQTKAENIFWEFVRDKRFLGLKFYRQHPLFHDLLGKETFYVADFFCHKKRIVIELDGQVHKYQQKSDMKRTEVIKLLGYDIIRFYNDDVENNIDEVLKVLAKRLV